MRHAASQELTLRAACDRFGCVVHVRPPHRRATPTPHVSWVRGGARRAVGHWRLGSLGRLREQRRRQQGLGALTAAATFRHDTGRELLICEHGRMQVVTTEHANWLLNYMPAELAQARSTPPPQTKQSDERRNP